MKYYPIHLHAQLVEEEIYDERWNETEFRDVPCLFLNGIEVYHGTAKDADLHHIWDAGDVDDFFADLFRKALGQ